MMTDRAHNNGVILETRNLVKVYRGASRSALDGLDVSVREGEVFGLLGPNGAGKTTAISIMTTLFEPTDGAVTICGVDAVRNPRDVKRLIGFVPQETALYSTLTGRENLRYFGAMYGLAGKMLEERISDAVELVGLSRNADRQVLTYSGGMKRRANLAAGIIHEPKLLFLDEPTVGIDPQSRNLILERLASLKSRITMVYTTHYMEEAEALCTRVAVMDAGRIIAEGSPKELVNREPGCSNLEDLFIRLTGKKLRDWH